MCIPEACHYFDKLSTASEPERSAGEESHDPQCWLVGRCFGLSPQHDRLFEFDNTFGSTLLKPAPRIMVRGRLYDSPPLSLGSSRSRMASPNMFRL